MVTYNIEELTAWDKEYVWHPFTQMKEYRQEPPLIIERGEGSYLIDVAGKRYLDAISSLWVTVHGHSHPLLNQAIKEQTERVAHSTLLGLANVPSIELAKKLVEITPAGLNKVFYSDAGATSVEIAIKIAFQYWQQKDRGQYKNKTKFISLGEAYHGDTIGSVSVGGMDLFHSMYKPLLFNIYHIPTPFCYRCPMGQNSEQCQRECFTAAEQVVRDHADEVAALIVEPLVQGAAGMIVQPAGYLRHLRDICTANNVLLICDEVAVGFGRTGTMFACEQEDVQPDLLCTAKGLTGGYLPLAATLTTDEVFNAFLGDYAEVKTFFHGHTYTGNPICCAAALANIRLIEQTNLVDQVKEKAAFLTQELERFKELKHVGDIRQKGMMIGLELVQDQATKAPYPWEQHIAHQVVLAARQDGLIIRPLDNVIVLMPILGMSLGELKAVADKTYAAIKSVTEAGPV